MRENPDELMDKPAVQWSELLEAMNDKDYEELQKEWAEEFEAA